jgi:regulator of sirC expression with transglutaminase-like and TPR domain
MDFPIARQHLYRLLRQPEPFSLAEAALYIAQETYPDLQIEVYLTALDEMATDIQSRLPQERYPLKMIQAINRHLFETLGFRGNEQNYYDPRNSFLNEVLERRTGIPITLSLIYLEVSRRLEFPMVGVNFPGHFLIRPLQEDMEIYVDPFHQGEVLFPQDCQAKLEALYQRKVELRDTFFDRIEPRQFLTRLLTNLKHIYHNQGQLQECLAVSERLLLINPTAIAERRDRGLLYYQLGRWIEARQDFQDYLAQSPQAPDQALIVELLSRIV